MEIKNICILFSILFLFSFYGCVTPIRTNVTIIEQEGNCNNGVDLHIIRKDSIFQDICKARLTGNVFNISKGIVTRYYGTGNYEFTTNSLELIDIMDFAKEYVSIPCDRPTTIDTTQIDGSTCHQVFIP